MKKILTFTLLTLLLLSLFTTGYATDDEYSEVPTEGIPAVGGIGSASGSKTLRASLYITDWANGITESGTGQITMSEYTDCSTTANQIKHTMILQQWNGSNWVPSSSSVSSRYNTSVYSNNAVRSVTRDKYYRVVSTHQVYDNGGLADTETATSSYIYVD